MAKTNSPLRSGVVERLSHSEERFRLLVESVQDCALYMLDPAGCVASWNQGAERMKGYRSEEIVGRHFSRFYTREDRDCGKHDAALEAARGAGRFEGEGWRVRKDGSRFWAGVVITAIRDESGTLRGFGKVTRDLTERRRVEQELLDMREHLLALEHPAHADSAIESTCTQRDDQNADNATVDALTLMISRDLRPPLRNIETLAVQVREEMAQLNAMAARMDCIAHSAAALTKLTNDLLMFSRSGQMYRGNGRAADLESIVARARLDLGVAAQSPGIHWKIGKLPQVAGDPALLRVVFENVLSNAIKFSRQRNPPVIEVTARTASGDEIVIEIRDNGVGFSEQHAHRLFRAFQHLHDDSQYKGIGIGLATTKRIIESHGGRIWAKSRPDEGASFYFTLQRAVVTPG